MNLQRLLTINAVAMLAAGVVLFLWPELVPGVTGIELQRPAFFLCYLLGASELAIATLCFLAVKLSDAAALRAIVITCIVFHASSGVAGICAIVEGATAAVWWNVALRGVMVILFVRYGLRRSTS
jgi:hypothetical protein